MAGLEEWFEQNRQTLESAYLAAEEPWRQSGFSGPEDRWNRLRKPIAECVDRAGTFLDIGCANGYLLECVVRWCAERGVEVVPYGLDLSRKLVDLAALRLPQFASHLFVGNAWTWVPPRQFDFVRTELVYVPEALRREYVDRLLRLFVKPGGKLLVAEYRSRSEAGAQPWLTDELGRWGVDVERARSGYDAEGRELTRVIECRRVGERGVSGSWPA